jgi:hypothetical protein
VTPNEKQTKLSESSKYLFLLLVWLKKWFWIFFNDVGMKKAVEMVMIRGYFPIGLEEIRKSKLLKQKLGIDEFMFEPANDYLILKTINFALL